VDTDPQRLTYVIRDLPDGEYIITAYGLGALYEPQPCTLRVEAGRFVTRDFSLSHPAKP